jgi:hypothetical protein
VKKRYHDLEGIATIEASWQPNQISTTLGRMRQNNPIQNGRCNFVLSDDAGRRSVAAAADCQCAARLAANLESSKWFSAEIS